MKEDSDSPLTIHPNGTAMQMADDTVHDSMYDKENTKKTAWPCPAAEASAESETMQLGTEC
jgi:hypothetical protein